MPNAKQTTDTQLPLNLRLEQSEISCLRCGHVFAHFVFETIDDLVQLRCGDVIIPHTKMICMHCGRPFNWDVNDQLLEKMIVSYAELTVIMRKYLPE